MEHQEEQLDLFPELFEIYPTAIWERMGMWMCGELNEDPRGRAKCEVADADTTIRDCTALDGA